MRGLENKVAIVTGGAGGIGRAIVRHLLEDGARVVIFDLDKAAGQRAVEDFSTLSNTIAAMQVDITDHTKVGEAVASVLEDFGTIDVLVNNAGWDKAGPFVETTPEDWQKIIAINYVGALNLHHHVLPIMQKQQSGSVVNISSDAGRVGSTGESVYAGCKAALTGFGKSVARELARNGVRVNSVCPGPTNTALFDDFAGEGEYGDKLRAGLKRAIPMGRLGEPGDLAGVVCFLASEESGFITGQTISVSGGLTMHG